MKEFSSQTGGRYTYVDDILNLQELALAFSYIFNECDSFIISGCNVSGNSISAGYVYINGKIRHFKGASGIQKWPQYIYEKNHTESVPYASGADKVGRNVFGCVIGESVPAVIDGVTGEMPIALEVGQTGGPLMKDVFVGKYALLLNSAMNTQTVNGNVKFSGNITASGNITSSKSININGVNVSCRLTYDEKTFIISATDSIGNAYKFAIAEGEGFKFYTNGVLAMVVGEKEIKFELPIVGAGAVFNGIAIKLNNIYNSSNASDDGEIGINMLGLNGGNSKFRNTFIGNGKGRAILSVTGSSSSVLIDGAFAVSSSLNEGLVLKSTFSRDAMALVKSVVWKDKNDSVIANVGFKDDTNHFFSINNALSGIYITGADFVDIGPSIKENGTLLSEKYVKIENYKADLGKKAESSNVYSIAKSNELFATKNGGITQFITGVNTKEVLCKQLGVSTEANADKKYANVSKYLSDMATSEQAKLLIRTNIGAAAAGDFQKKLKDSGWIDLKNGLYVRQIGNIVSIQGVVHTIHSGTLFTLPSNIDAPTHAVYQSFSFSNSRNWTVCIGSNVRDCKVKYCSGSCGKTTEFSITYMV